MPRFAPSLPTVFRDLRIVSAFAVCLAAVALLLGFGRPAAALGVGIGFCLYLGNVLFLYETARSLIGASSGRRGGILSALSSVGRLLLLAAVLSGVGMLLGEEALLGACGGLFASQVNLHLPRSRAKEVA